MLQGTNLAAEAFATVKSHLVSAQLCMSVLTVRLDTTNSYALGGCCSA